MHKDNVGERVLSQVETHVLVYLLAKSLIPKVNE